jgi:NTP pyrophosphatase (non-canonical NTP hydrolase)
MKQNSIEELTEDIRKFEKERDWKQFHNPKDLAEAITIEASELLELFLWKKPEESYSKQDEHHMQNVKEEIADIFNYTLLFADSLGLDLVKLSKEKMKKNALKYPVVKAKGNAKKYTQLK